MTSDRKSARQRFEHMDHVEEVGDVGTGLVVYPSRDSSTKAFGGVIRETGWVPVMVDVNRHFVVFAPFEDIQAGDSK